MPRRALWEGRACCYRALGSLYGAIGSPYRPSVPLTRALFNCLIVGTSPGFNCIGLRVPLREKGLGRTYLERNLLKLRSLGSSFS